MKTFEADCGYLTRWDEEQVEECVDIIRDDKQYILNLEVGERHYDDDGARWTRLS